MLWCEFCEYETKRIDNYKRHLSSSKHLMNLRSEIKVETETKDTNVNHCFVCPKCASSYKTEKQFIIHKSKCIGIDAYTCKICMNTFHNYSNKSKHIKRANCKPVSILHYNQRIGRCASKNDLYINDYGNERIDYFDEDDIIEFVKYANSCKSFCKFLQLKHFDPNFYENHNITYKNNTFYIRKNYEWKPVTKEALRDKLYSDIGRTLYKFVIEYENKIRYASVHPIIYEEIFDSCNWTALDAKNEKKKIQKALINMVKESGTVNTR